MVLTPISRFFSRACFSCMSLHLFFIFDFAKLRQSWSGSGLMMHLH